MAFTIVLSQRPKIENSILMKTVTRLLILLSIGVFVVLFVLMARDKRIANRDNYLCPGKEVVEELKYFLENEQFDVLDAKSSHYIKYYPYSGELYGLRAIAEAKLGNYIRSETDTDRAILINPSVNWIYVARGICRLESLRLGRALSEFDSAEQLGTGNSIFFAARAETEAALNLFKASWIDSEKALKLNPRNVDALTIQAELLLARLQYEQVLANVRFAEKREPDNLAVKTIKLCALDGLGQKQEASLEARKIVKLAGEKLQEIKAGNSKWGLRDSVIASTARGYAFLYENKIQPAISDFSQVLNMVPCYPLALEGKAKALLKANKLKEALDCLSGLEGIKNNRMSVILLEAEIYYQQKEYAKSYRLVDLLMKRGCNLPQVKALAEALKKNR